MNPTVDRPTSLSAEDLAAVLEQLPSGVLVVDRRGLPRLTNEPARRVLRQLPGGAASLTALSRSLRGEAVSSEECTFDSGQGEPLRLRVSGIPLKTYEGTISGAALVFTDRTAEHHEHRRTEEALQGSQQRLRLALEASHMGTWDYDVQRDRVEWSPEMASVTGSPMETLAGPIGEGLKHIHADDLPDVQRAIREALERGQSLKLETRIVHEQTGRVRWVMLRGRVYRDSHGRPLRMTGIAMDITERREAEAARQTFAHGERLRALGEMASGIAHDLNQSLALITGYSDMARQELSHEQPDVARVREMVEITARAAIEGGQALKGLLSFVRTQQLMADEEQFDLGQVLRDAAKLTRPRWRNLSQAEGRPITLHVKAEPGCVISGAPSALREAVTNLILNAVDALPKGGTIDLSCSPRGEDVRLEISDTGTGIPEELQARIFDPFFTTKGEQGTGLGLPQVVAIVDRHGGRLDLDSAPGRGTTFRMTFPAASAPTARTGEPSEQQLEEAKRRSISILVVEDEQQLARMASLVLSQRGHRVQVAETCEQAVAHLEREPFELVISDLGLGTGKNGWDLAAEVRARWPAVRFVLVTGWGAAIDPQEAHARGVHQVIAKPYRIADLRDIADRVASASPTE